MVQHVHGTVAAEFGCIANISASASTVGAWSRATRNRIAVMFVVAEPANAAAMLGNAVAPLAFMRRRSSLSGKDDATTITAASPSRPTATGPVGDICSPKSETMCRTSCEVSNQVMASAR